MVSHLYEFYIAKKNSLRGPRHFGQRDGVSTACPVCFAGVLRSSPAIFDYVEARGASILMDYDRRIFIHEAIKKLMDAAGLIGFKVTKAIDFQRRQFPFVYYELTATGDLPPMADSSIYCRDQVCKQCRRGGYTIFSGTQSRELHYSKQSLDSIPPADFYRTWEFWGSPDWIARKIYPHQDLIVSERFKELLECEKIPRVKFPRVAIE